MKPGPAAGRRRSAPSSKLKLDKTIGDVPVDSTLAHPPALGARPEVPRARSAGHVASRRSATATRSRSQQADADVELDEVFEMFDADARGSRRRTCAASATRSPAAAAPSTARSRTLPRAASAPRAGDAQPVATRTPSCARFFKELGDAARDRRAGRRSSNAHAVHADGRHLRGDRARPARRSQDTIAKPPPTLDVGDRVASACSARSSRDLTAFSARLRRRDRRAARRAAAASTPRSRPARRCSARAPQLNERARGRVRRARATSPRRRRPTPRCAR